MSVISFIESEEDVDKCHLSGAEHSIDSEAEYRDNYWEDEDDIYQEFEELDFDALLDHTDTPSVTLGDSFYHPDTSALSHLYRFMSPEPKPISFFKACCNNNSVIIKFMIRQGVTEEEVQETDRNNRSGLIVACYHGYVDVVIALSQCPYIDVNWQDNEGNTALITAAQAGHVIISNYLLNYFPWLDIERKNCHGFTALMKAAMQGRADCVRAIMMAGANVEARDYGRHLTPREWALFTGRYDTAHLMDRLMMNPCAEQFCDTFCLEWPMLQELVTQSQNPKSCWNRFSKRISCCPYKFYINNRVNFVYEGVLDHMVRVTTSIFSPFIATACHTVCPGSPPCIGKRRLAVQEILRRQQISELKRLRPDRVNNYQRFFQNSQAVFIPKTKDWRVSLQPQLLSEMATASATAMRRASLLSLTMLRRSNMQPGIIVPTVRLYKAPAPSFTPENLKRSRNHNQLQIPN
ncbi:ankyrin repeat domain-containing protein 33B-like [Thalassophryne amazonica]|uniref:ankyrin repeat domain-containing protein 33B-like n=1 Tax=Thalassophryne amazonica TaxID=390379 RepID=UPI001471A9ED|nr:ankyrin repeat domain-containing protein 33B-like [Thalassophryne amazonica]